MGVSNRSSVASGVITRHDPSGPSVGASVHCAFLGSRTWTGGLINRQHLHWGYFMARTDRGKHDWFQIRGNLLSDIKTMRIANECGVTLEAAFITLYELASWFRSVGKYGVISAPIEVIDRRTRIPGFAAAMIQQDWLRVHGDAMTLAGFTNVSAIRKSLGRKLRRKILSEGACRLCASPGPLVVDHIIPVVKGGHSEESNLQPLCGPCNAKKGRA